MSHLAELRTNQLLASMPVAELQRWLPQFERVTVHADEVLCETGAIPTHVLFPATAIVSLVYETASGASAEIAVVGNEGMVGIALLMGGQSTPSRAVVRSSGTAWRLPAQTVKDTFEGSNNVRRLLLHYTLTVMAQMAQTAACNRYHAIDQQLCRWLLLSLDRLPGREIAITQEQIAQMLGVRRESVTEGALALQKDHLITYARGQISVLDRRGLEERACGCYAAVRKEQDRLLPPRVMFGRHEAGSGRRPASLRASAMHPLSLVPS